MFHNVGKKIKAIVKWSTVLLFVALPVTGVVLFSLEDGLEVLGMLLIPAPLLLVIPAIFLYGYGELVDTAIALRQQAADAAGETAPTEQSAPSDAVPLIDVPDVSVPVEAAPPAEPTPNVASYFGKKWCGACGRLHGPEVTVCTCGSQYIGVITPANAANIIPNIRKD